MTPVKAIVSLSKIYKPGAIEFFGSMPDDPWQKANDDFEAKIIFYKSNEQRIHEATRVWFQELKELLELYSKLKPAKASLNLTAFMLQSEDASDAQWSLREKRCAVCATESDVRVGRTQEGRVALLCSKHNYKTNRR